MEDCELWKVKRKCADNKDTEQRNNMMEDTNLDVVAKKSEYLQSAEKAVQEAETAFVMQYEKHKNQYL